MVLPFLCDMQELYSCHLSFREENEQAIKGSKQRPHDYEHAKMQETMDRMDGAVRPNQEATCVYINWYV